MVRHMKLVVSFLLMICCAIGAERKMIVAADGAKPAGPYSPGVFVGDFLYVSGQGSRDMNGQISANQEERLRQTFRNVEAIVRGAGLTMEHVLYLQVYLHSAVSYEQMNKVWNEFFKKNFPARATLGVAGMPADGTVQINAVAVRDLSMKKVIRPEWYPKNMTISPAVEANGRIYLSGFLGRELETGKIPADPKEQVTLGMTRIKQILEAAGLDFRHLVFVNPYLTKSMPRRALDEVYAKYFEHGNTPARATIEVAFLPNGANIEFTGIAVRDLSKRVAVRPRNMPPSPTASPCVYADDTLYCSAKSGFIPGANGGIWFESLEDQLRMTMRNLLDGLEEAGLDFSKVVATNVYLDSADDFAKMNAIYGKFFPANLPPTRSTVAPTALVERKRSASGHSPKLEEVSLIAVK